MTASSAKGMLEFAPQAEIARVQERLLRNHLDYLAADSPYYRELFRSRGIDVTSITLETLRTLPLTDKTILSEYNEDFLAAPMAKVVDIVFSSGTTGRSTMILYTENDLRRLAYNEEISFASCGLTVDDIVLLTCTMDRCFVAGLAYFSGVRTLGAAAVRNGLCSVESHREIIQRLKPTALVGVPTFLLKLGQFLKAQNIDPLTLGVKKMVCIGEPIRGRDLEFLKVGEQLEQIWGARIYSTYASSETITSFCECTAQQGGHLHPDLAVVEIVDEAGNVLPPGDVGEVVVTPLAIEGVPLLRFRTGDVSFIIDAPCACGRNSLRLGPILGRKQQMLKVRGTAFYPNAIYSVLDSLPGINEYYLSVASDFDLSDMVTVYVAVNDESLSAESIAAKIQAHVRVRPDVVVVGEEQVKKQVYAGNPRKISRFVDQRKNI